MKKLALLIVTLVFLTACTEEAILYVGDNPTMITQNAAKASNTAAFEFSYLADKADQDFYKKLSYYYNSGYKWDAVIYDTNRPPNDQIAQWHLENKVGMILMGGSAEWYLAGTQFSVDYSGTDYNSVTLNNFDSSNQNDWNNQAHLFKTAMLLSVGKLGGIPNKDKKIEPFPLMYGNEPAPKDDSYRWSTLAGMSAASSVTLQDGSTHKVTRYDPDTAFDAYIPVKKMTAYYRYFGRDNDCRIAGVTHHQERGNIYFTPTAGYGTKTVSSTLCKSD